MTSHRSILKNWYLWGIILVSLLITALFVTYGFYGAKYSRCNPQGVYVGVDAAYDNVTQIKNFVDEMSPYTNLMVIGSQGITFNVAKLNDVCSYIYNHEMNFMIYMHPENTSEGIAEQRQWLDAAKTKWGNKFLGLYSFDEPGGRQLDKDQYTVLENWSASNFTDAANQYTSTLSLYLQHMIKYNYGAEWSLVTSDYAAYWFDYKGGYNVVFAEFGWNYSRQLNVALDRGAANVQGKDWGVMITWTYTNYPYLEDGTELYKDLVLAYDSGAKYILIFDANANYTGTTLEKGRDGHYDALKRFCQYAIDNPRPSSSPAGNITYVLPDGYAYGFRGPNDTIWGLWGADNFSFKISTELGGLIDQYQNSLDIIYDDGLQANTTYGYSRMIFWNGTDYVP